MACDVGSKAYPKAKEMKVAKAKEPTQQTSAVVERLVPSFAAGVIISVAFVISLPTAIIVVPATAAITSVAVTSSTVSVAIPTISGSYRFAVTTSDTSRATVASIAIATAAASTTV